MTYQITDPGSSENTKQDKYQETTLRHITFKLQKIKDKETILKEARGKKHLTYGGTKKRKELHPTSPQKSCKQEESGEKYLKY